MLKLSFQTKFERAEMRELGEIFSEKNYNNKTSKTCSKISQGGEFRLETKYCRRGGCSNSSCRFENRGCTKTDMRIAHNLAYANVHLLKVSGYQNRFLLL